jgi:uncharacterized protein YrrD
MDKLAGDMIGLPVVTLDSGATIAHVDDMLVDPSRRQVLALVVQEKAFARSARAIPFGRIAANGVDAVLVPNAKVTFEVDRDPVLRSLDNTHRVQGANVMTDTGRKVGRVVDMLIDDHTGEIKTYEVVMGPDNAKHSLPAEAVISLGKEAMFVTGAAADALDVKPTKEIDVRDATGAPLAAEAATTPAGEEGITPMARPAATPEAKLTDIATMLGGNSVNVRLLFGIVILVLGILILVYPALLPLIAGISLIVIGLWIALQNAPTGTRP